MEMGGEEMIFPGDGLNVLAFRDLAKSQQRFRQFSLVRHAACFSLIYSRLKAQKKG